MQIIVTIFAVEIINSGIIQLSFKKIARKTKWCDRIAYKLSNNTMKRIVFFYQKPTNKQNNHEKDFTAITTTFRQKVI